MIKRIAAYVDSQGGFHETREDACKAEFRRLLGDRFWGGPPETDAVLKLSEIVDALFDLDKMIGEATREDTRASFVEKPDAKA